jgi:quinolinate synthase
MIVFCGVRFMAESAKILSPHKKVLLPASNAGCPMADMVTPADIKRLRAEYPDAAVVCYVNSSCDVKAECDVCVTSSNAVKIVRDVPEKRVVFVPDQNLARYVAAQVPEKEVIPFSGYCIVHHQIAEIDVDKAIAAIPGAPLLVHPECPEAVTSRADFVGSTAQIIDYAKNSPENQFIIGTEMGILHVLQQQNPDKRFYLLSPKLICANMKKTHLSDVYEALLNEQHEIILDEAVMNRARLSLDRMLKMS